MRSLTRLSWFVLLLAALLLTSCSLAAPAPAGAPSGQLPTAAAPAQQAAQPLELPTRRPSAAAGAALYQEKCVRCHGASGQGDGAMAAQIKSQFGSPVADLTSDVVARAQTPEKWYTTVTNGRIEKGMPPFAGSLDVNQRWDVIAYAWSLATPPQQLARGQQVYTEQCAHCHGDAGRGDGKDASGKLPDLSAFATLAKIEPGRLDQALDSAHVPSFAGTLSADAKRAAVDYLRTFVYDSASAAATAPSSSATPASSAGSLPSVATPIGPGVPSVLSGKIINGTAGQPVPDNLDMTLYIVSHQGAQQDIVSRTFQSGVGGQYSITVTQIDPTNLLAVGTDYKGVSFYSDLVVPGPQATAPITIYESTQDVSQVAVDTLHIVAIPTASGLNVSEIYVLSNNGDRFVAGFGSPVMHFALPADGVNLQLDEAQRRVMAIAGDGIDYYDVIPVGSQAQQIVLQYTLPPTATSLGRILYHPTASVNLLVEGTPDKAPVTANQLTPMAPQSIQGTPYQRFTASNLAAGLALAITVGTPQGQSLDWRLALGGLLIVVGVGGLIFWQRSQKKQAPAVVALGDEQEALIDEIAELDDKFAAGQIDEINYRAKRTKLKDKLMKLMEAE